jgi:hypothetical protein
MILVANKNSVKQLQDRKIFLERCLEEPWPTSSSSSQEYISCEFMEGRSLLMNKEIGEINKRIADLED